MLLLQIVKLLMLSHVRDVAVAVVAVVAEVHQVPPVESGAGAQITVLPVLVSVVDFEVHALFAVGADAVVRALLSHQRGVHFVDSARKVLILQWQTGMVERHHFFAYIA